jgi:hypothetical protein
MRFPVVLLLLLYLSPLLAQQVVMSDPEKLSTKTPNASILGKSNEGIIVYKYGKGMDVVEAYNSNMRIRWKKTLNIKQESSSILKMILYPAKTSIFFLSQTKTYSVVYAQQLSSKFTGDGKFIVVDTLLGDRADIAKGLTVVNSQNKAHLALYYPVMGNSRIESIYAVGMSEELGVEYKTRIILPADAATYELAGIVPDNTGNLAILLESRERGKKNITEKEFRAFYYHADNGQLQEINYTLQKPVFGNVALEVDNVNNRIVLAGFYSYEERKDARGFFFEAFSPGVMDGSNPYVAAYQDFPDNMMFQITGKDTAKNDKGLYSFRIKDIILRHDGGAVFIAESQFDNTENVEMPSFGPTSGPNIRTVKVHYFNDIMVMSLSPRGAMDWFNILKKKQVSEDDDGFYSSFCLVNTDDHLRFVYNDEIYYKTNVNEYMMDRDGKADRSLIVNSGEKEILMVPSLAKQISANEVLIPSFRKNTLRFVKIAY